LFDHVPAVAGCATSEESGTPLKQLALARMIELCEWIFATKRIER
jgi:hypothetical protein